MIIKIYVSHVRNDSISFKSLKMQIKFNLKLIHKPLDEYISSKRLDLV